MLVTDNHVFNDCNNGENTKDYIAPWCHINTPFLILFPDSYPYCVIKNAVQNTDMDTVFFLWDVYKNPACTDKQAGQRGAHGMR